jgi:SAM-dependent methyltransferase
VNAMTPNAIWHDVECGSYAADLPLWEELAEQAGGPVLELGCGTGRVALHLARHGHGVVGLDHDPELLAVLEERAADFRPSRVGAESDGIAKPGVVPVLADARSFELDEAVALVLAPTHLLQLLDGSEERVEALRCVAAALRPGGLFAASILEELPEADGAPPPLPDVREVEGWVYSSLATEVAVGTNELRVRRLRQTVSPGGSLNEEPNEVRIATFAAELLESEAAGIGLTAIDRREIPPTDLHVGSIVLIFQRSG